MGGWGAVSLTVAPDGTALPCPSAATLPALDAPNVRAHRLDWIWRESKAFNAYRGEAWMPDPCRGCALRTTDFGGCRCQAYALTGDASRTDPACRHAPDHHLVRALVDEARSGTPPTPTEREEHETTTAGSADGGRAHHRRPDHGGRHRAPDTFTPRACGRPAAAQDWSVALIDSTMARYTPSTIGGWSYPVGLYLYGQYLTYQRTHDARYLTYIKSYVDRFVSSDGSIGQSFNSLDSMQAGGS